MVFLTKFDELVTDFECLGFVFWGGEVVFVEVVRGVVVCVG